MTDATPPWPRRLRAAIIRPFGRRRRVPTVFQMEAVECGAAALAMILAYHGKHVPLEELRVACGVSRDGSKALNVLRAARSYGFTAKGLKKEPADLARLDGPVIIFWRFNHFLVLERYTASGAVLVDPALGRRHATVDEFDRSFTGVVLQLTPGPGFARSGASPSLFRTLSSRLRGAHAALAFATLVALAAVVPGIVVPVLSTVFIDQVLIGGQGSWLAGVIGVALCTLLVGCALTALQRFVAIRLETSVAVISSAKLFWQALRLPLAFYHQRSAADIAGRIVLNNRVAHAISSDILGGAAAMVTVLVFAAVMLAYDRAMGAATIAFTLLSVAVTSLLSRKRVDLGTRLSIEHGKLNATAMNGIAIIESVKATGTEPEFFSRLMGNFAHYQNALQEFGKLTAVVDFVPKSFAALNMAVLFGMGGLRVMQGEMSFGALVAFQALAVSFFVPVAAIVSTLNRLGALRGDLVRLEDIEGSAQRYDALRPQAAPAALPEGKLEGRIEFQDVSFGYSRLEPAIVDGFNLVVEPGMRVGLVGGSGCGKSTIAKLALGHYELWGGSILLDGQPVGAWSKLQRQSALASIDQDISLFSGSIRDNITMWDESVEERHLVDAASDACIHEVIMERPGGYEAQVTEGGANFSGGQRQRLEIARALVQRPRILVVDEGTSALDPVTEEAVMNAIKRRGCTCLIVAHRLSAIRDCDLIVVLDGGRIVERGSHEELLAQGGRYASLISSE